MITTVRINSSDYHRLESFIYYDLQSFTRAEITPAAILWRVFEYLPEYSRIPSILYEYYLYSNTTVLIRKIRASKTLVRVSPAVAWGRIGGVLDGVLKITIPALSPSQLPYYINKM